MFGKTQLGKGTKKCAKCLWKPSRNAWVLGNPDNPITKISQYDPENTSGRYRKLLNSHFSLLLLTMTQNVMYKAYILPGPSSTERGFPVLRTGSPTVTPAVDIIRQRIKITDSLL